MKNDLAFLRLPFEVSLHTGMRKNIELLKLKVEHVNFSSRPVFFPIHGGSVEIPSNWLIVVKGKRGKYRLIPMNSKARTILFEAVKDRGLHELVFDKDANGVNEYMLRWGERMEFTNTTFRISWAIQSRESRLFTREPHTEH